MARVQVAVVRAEVAMAGSMNTRYMPYSLPGWAEAHELTAAATRLHVEGWEAAFYGGKENKTCFVPCGPHVWRACLVREEPLQKGPHAGSCLLWVCSPSRHQPGPPRGREPAETVAGGHTHTPAVPVGTQASEVSSAWGSGKVSGDGRTAPNAGSAWAPSVHFPEHWESPVTLC